MKMNYKSKCITAAEAAAMVKDGDRMYWGLAHGASRAFDEALSHRADELHGVQVFSTLPMRRKPFETYTAASGPEHVRFNSTHFGGPERRMAGDKGCWFVPIQFRELPKYWMENLPPFDFAVVSVGPADEHGNFNIGPQVADLWGLVASAKTVIVEVNRDMPYAHGREVSLPVDRVDYIIEDASGPLMEVPAGRASDVELQMARTIAGMIESGSTLQLGIGALPNVIGQELCRSDVRDLSVHTEMLVDAYVDLYEAGKITGNKRQDRGQMVYTFCGGTRKLYDFIDHNPVCCCGPVDYVNSIEAISANDKMISINSCLEVDLFGQVSAESVGPKQISGTGGQLDYVLGAFLSRGGKSFLCTPSVKTLKSGEKVSTITAGFLPGTAVTTPRSVTHYIVTEYGAVNLKGRSTWERAEALISVAHPDFREQLIREADRMGIWTRTNQTDWN